MWPPLWHPRRQGFCGPFDFSLLRGPQDNKGYGYTLTPSSFVGPVKAGVV